MVLLLSPLAGMLNILLLVQAVEVETYSPALAVLAVIAAQYLESLLAEVLPQKHR